METAIQLVRAAAEPLVFTDEQRQMIRDSFAGGASDAEFGVLLEIARVRRLNPLLKQIHFVQRWDSEKHRMVWSTQVSIDGLRAIAERTGLYNGQDEPEFEEGPEGTIKLCKVRVHRKDWSRPAVGVAYWNEYVQTTRDKQTGKTRPTAMWGRMPHVMLAKVAESIALRKAFPEDMSGLYSDAEMSQAENDNAPPGRARVVVAAVAAPAPALEQLPASNERHAPPSEEPEAEEPEEAEGPSSRAWATYVDALPKASTLAEVHRLYNALVDGLNEEGADVQHFTQGDDGAGKKAHARMAAVGAKLSVAERDQVLRSRPLAELLDTQAHIVPSDTALKNAALWWITHRAKVNALEEQAHRSTPYYSLVRRYSGASDAAATKRARAALDEAVKALDKPTPPDGTNGGAKGAQGASQASGAPAESAHANSGARAMLDDYRAHLAAIPTRGADGGRGRVAGSYWKRREDFTELGVRAEALAIVVDELTARGVAEPHTWLTEIGERNGYVTRTQKAA